MYFKFPKAQGGFSLVELMIAMAIFAVAMATVMSVYLFSSRTFAVLANYAELDQVNRNALDIMTKEIRAAQTVVTNTSTSLTFIAQNGDSVTYSFDPTRKLLIRADGTSSEILLTNCDLMTFSCGQLNTSNQSWDFYPPANGPTSIKEIQLTWKARCNVPGSRDSVSENVQTAQVVIRAAREPIH